MSADPLLGPDEPPACEVVHAGGGGTAFLICDHASHRVPRRLATLGLSDEQRRQHIGWDIGAAQVARRLSQILDAELVLSGYSRLVIDCNRPPGVPSSIPRETGGVVVPGNQEMDAEAAQARAAACFWPYHHTITALLDRRAAAGRPTHLLSVHSFTPSLFGQERPWHVAMLSGRDRRLAQPFLDILRRDPTLCVGDNQPYRITDQGDYGIPVHGERRGVPCVLIEIRQDLIDTPEGAHAWAERLAAVQRETERVLRERGPVLA